MSTATIQIMSDLHLETHRSYHYGVKQTAPYLALLGDIGHVADDGLFSFLEEQLHRYWTVFFLLGNHEPVGTSWPLAKSRVRAFAARMEQLRARSTLGRFVFLDQTRYDLSETLTVLGCTLFSRVARDEADAVGRLFIDFQQIQGWELSDHLAAHEADLRWLNSQVAAIARDEPQRQIAILTHHCPTADARAQDPRFQGSPVSSGFTTDLAAPAQACWTSPAVVLWAFGHTHYSRDFVDDHGKRVVANQRGYASALEPAFDETKAVLVGRRDPRTATMRSMLD